MRTKYIRPRIEIIPAYAECQNFNKGSGLIEDPWAKGNSIGFEDEDDGQDGDGSETVSQWSLLGSEE